MMDCIYYLPCEERKTHDSSDLTLGPMLAAVQRTGAGRGGCCRGGELGRVTAGMCAAWSPSLLQAHGMCTGWGSAPHCPH